MQGQSPKRWLLFATADVAVASNVTSNVITSELHLWHAGWFSESLDGTVGANAAMTEDAKKEVLLRLHRPGVQELSCLEE